MKLFDTKKVQKFFSILHKMERGVAVVKGKDIYEGKCQKQIFVKRTLNKWLSGKVLIIYKESEQTGVEYKQYVSITNIEYCLGWGEEIDVNLFDYTRPTDIFNKNSFNHNSILSLEGEWSENSDIHHQILKLTYLNIPEKDYVFKTYDWNKYPKRRKKHQTEDDIIKLMEGTISFRAKTEKEAYRKKKKFEKSEENKITMLSDVIEIREVSDKDLTNKTCV